MYNVLVESFRADFGIEVPWKYTGWTPWADRPMPDEYDDRNMHVYKYDENGNEHVDDIYDNNSPHAPTTQYDPSRMDNSEYDDPLMAEKFDDYRHDYTSRDEMLHAEGFEDIAPEDTFAFADKYTSADDFDFNKTYWSNYGRSNGIRPGNQVDLYYDQGIAMSTGSQRVPRPSNDWNWNEQSAPQTRTSELFDVSDEFAEDMDDPRELVKPNNGPYKKLTRFGDNISYITRQRNDRQLNEARNAGISAGARRIFTATAQYELAEQEQRPWWARHEI